MQILCFGALVISNYHAIIEYNSNYEPENFTIKHMLEPKYRCIRYFDDKQYSKYYHIKCADYLYDYTDFMLERSRYIYIFYIRNMIAAVLLVLFHLLL